MCSVQGVSALNAIPYTISDIQNNRFRLGMEALKKRLKEEPSCIPFALDLTIKMSIIKYNFRLTKRSMPCIMADV